MPKQKKVGKYELKETVGKGTFSKVKRAVHCDTGEQVAIKIVNISNLEKEGMEKQVKREILVLKSIKHKNVVQMKEVLKSTNHIYIVMELVLGGELFDTIVAYKRFDEDTARKFFQQLIEGIIYCHQQGVAHRDLKPENLLLDGDTLKISDFGLSGIVRNNAMLNTICGTPHYVSPEVLSGQYDGMIADIWSCGIILFVMVSGCHPFDGETVQELFKRIENLEFKYPPYFSKELRCLLDKIVIVNPDKRATLRDIIIDPWFKTNFKPFDQSCIDRLLKTEDGTGKKEQTNGEDENLDYAVMDANVEYDENDESQSKNKQEMLLQAEKLNAFEVISYMTKDSMNLLFSRSIQKRSLTFISEGNHDEVLKRMDEFLQTKKVTVRQKQITLELKCRCVKKLSDTEFTVQLFPMTNSFVLVEMARVRGSVILYSEMYRVLRSKFVYHKDGIAENDDNESKEGSNNRESSSNFSALDDKPTTSTT